MIAPSIQTAGKIVMERRHSSLFRSALREVQNSAHETRVVSLDGIRTDLTLSVVAWDILEELARDSGTSIHSVLEGIRAVRPFDDLAAATEIHVVEAMRARATSLESQDVESLGAEIKRS